VRFLLDTNVFLWLQTSPDRLGAHQLSLLEPTNALFLSAASAWEIAIKYGLGKLPLPVPPERYVSTYRRRIGAESLAVSEAHASAVASLPPLHGDPFDRLLVAQARSDEMTIVTGDTRIAQYDVPVVLV
jgi:PIN domain nuclease of toxin-antitoxin system